MNRDKQLHDFILQLNVDFEKECNAFLILQALHYASCSLSMMTGAKMPALVSIQNNLLYAKIHPVFYCITYR
jgi:hypothetical protein